MLSLLSPHPFLLWAQPLGSYSVMGKAVGEELLGHLHLYIKTLPESSGHRGDDRDAALGELSLGLGQR